MAIIRKHLDMFFLNYYYYVFIALVLVRFQDVVLFSFEANKSHL